MDEAYPIFYIYVTFYSVHNNSVIQEVDGSYHPEINTEERKEVLTISVEDNEISKYCLSTLNKLKDCRVKDIRFIYVDGLSGIKDCSNISPIFKLLAT